MVDRGTYNSHNPLIHIGFPRSASTWLQSRLFQPECGFFQIMEPVAAYLSFIEPPAFSFQPDKVVTWIKNKLDASAPQLNNGTTPVITSEALAGKTFGGGYNGKEVADRIKMVLPEGKILIIVREQKAILLSLYHLMVKWGLPHSLEQFLNPIGPRVAPQFNYAYLNYHLIVSYYQNIFGKDHVRVLPFELFTSDPESFVRSIYEFSDNMDNLEAGLTNLSFNKKVNASEPFLRLICRRYINYFLVRGAFNYSGLITHRGSSRLFKALIACLRVSDFIPDSVHKRVKNKAAALIAHESRGKFADSNRALENLIHMDLSQYGYEK